eukprot:CAMPEP_0202390776 /NCGR_PEP_ID=MMETSP1127-20130417/90475_1 /ASSEMBLY_ACC=CAM_ASM_000462 /TAXON_ID=3047 /ORGANISM="Dunaliella tertiolecta, Strain CCMP1320" /LENGTH=56 /DNA_ID=CAMNT_0048993105 /DNA_START=56 /DNA_END=224 /DNA_ORIENTATION=+
MSMGPQAPAMHTHASDSYCKQAHMAGSSPDDAQGTISPSAADKGAAAAADHVVGYV